ncbi:MAG TPA: calcium/sodium antiporter [Candidatus Bipolaricaulota bacterium]|nr:calcium/sodium antiporter [Candidatus Bipolaricaulota bacterium]
MALTYIFFIAGFLFLIKGADFLVDGAASIAKKFKISTLVIGLTVVSFGTSAPELVVNIISSIRGSGDLAVGNIIGSNIANILLILGVSALICALSVKRGTIWKEIPFSLMAILVVFVLVNDSFFDKTSVSMLSRIDGIILLAFFALFLYYTFSIAKVHDGEKDSDIKTHGMLLSAIMIALGLAGLTFGGKWIVDGAIMIANQLGIGEAVIGLTVVAIGTSLPELATSAIAAYKKQSDIAIGNVVGSNIFNLFWILGLSAVIRPLSFTTALNRDIIVCIFATFLLFIFMFVGKKHKLEKWQGAVFVGLYIAYLVVLVFSTV